MDHKAVSTHATEHLQPTFAEPTRIYGAMRQEVGTSLQGAVTRLWCWAGGLTMSDSVDRHPA
jgi:hypothetical protein